jgi:hypothetical protein
MVSVLLTVFGMGVVSSGAVMVTVFVGVVDLFMDVLEQAEKINTIKQG